MSFVIATDTSANLPAPLCEERGLTVVPFSYYVDGQEYNCLDTESFDDKKYYNHIREGAKVTTSQITPQTYTDFFEPILAAGNDVLFISMSSGISGSYASSVIASGELREKYPDRRVISIDTIGASLGEGFFAIIAADCRDKGMTLDETAEYVQSRIMGMCQVFTVDDLMHLKRTGRLSNAGAIIGTVLGIKPLLKGNEFGQIVSFAKIRGRKQSIRAIAEQYDRLVVDAASQTIGIAHADCLDDCNTLIELLKRNNPPKDIMVVKYEPVTGSHVGPGALALFFFGSETFRAEGSDSVKSSLREKGSAILSKGGAILEKTGVKEKGEAIIEKGSAIIERSGVKEKGEAIIEKSEAIIEKSGVKEKGEALYDKIKSNIRKGE